MASAPSPFASSKETTNYARLCRLLVGLGSQALRDTFDRVHPPSTLHGVLLSHKPTLQPLYTGVMGKKKVKKVLNPTQWGKLYPVHSPVTSASFDITLLTVLLRNICGFSCPAAGWDNLPPPTDTSTADDIARVKYYRNTVYGHANQASVDDASFSTYWQEIREALVRLGGPTFRGYIDNLEHDTMDPDMEEHFRELMKQWKKDDDSIKEKLEEMEDKLEQMKREMENNILGEMKEIKERLDSLAASLEENKDDENTRDKLKQMNIEMKTNFQSEIYEMKERLDTLTASLEENKDEERYRDDLDKMKSEISEKLDALILSIQETNDEKRYRDDVNKMKSEISDKLDSLTVSLQETKDEGLESWLARWNTPIHPWNIPNLPNEFSLFIKRDDLTGSTLSGNKVRKLEFLLADALDKKCDTVLTCGGIQSNHCRSTAVSARQLGLNCYLFLRNPHQITDIGCKGNLLLNRMVGSHAIVVPPLQYKSGLKQMMEKLAEKLKEQGSSAYLIEVGGSSYMGMFGYLTAFEEMINQNLLENFDDIVITVASGGSAAGIAIANYLTGSKLKCHAVNVCDNAAYFYDKINEDLRSGGLDVQAEDIIDIIEGYKGKGYAISSQEELENILEISTTTGIMVDPVYNIKAIRGMLHEMKNNPGRFKGHRILYIHTGGVFGLYDGRMDPLVKSCAVGTNEVHYWGDFNDPVPC